MAPTPRDLPQHRRRLRRVMEHIGAALRAGSPAGDDALCLPALARVACWSPEHLDRIYRLHVGEPPMATVRRLRLQAAADSLQRSGAPRSQWQVFGRGDEAAATPVQRRAGARVVLEAAVLAAPLCHAPDGFGRGVIAGGTYARMPVGPLAGLDERLHDAGWQRSDERVLRHYDTDPAYTAPPERREWLYVPVARRG